MHGDLYIVWHVTDKTSLKNGPEMRLKICLSEYFKDALTVLPCDTTVVTEGTNV
jgi:hypothetical protein